MSRSSSYLANSSRDRSFDRNRNSRIVSREIGTAVTTTTEGRDPGSLNVSMFTSPTGTTYAALSRAGVSIQLTGHEVRTLMRAFDKHEGTRIYGE